MLAIRQCVRCALHLAQAEALQSTNTQIESNVYRGNRPKLLSRGHPLKTRLLPCEWERLNLDLAAAEVSNLLQGLGYVWEDQFKINLENRPGAYHF